jgi:hypothetical protein
MQNGACVQYPQERIRAGRRNPGKSAPAGGVVIEGREQGADWNTSLGGTTKGVEIAVSSILPKRFEALWRQLGVADRALNVFVPEIVLNRSRVLSIVRELVPAGMSKHVEMHWKWKLPLFPDPCDKLSKARCRHGPQPLSQKNMPRFYLFPFQPPQRAYLSSTHRVHAWCSVLQPTDMQQSMFEIDLVPSQPTQLPSPQSVRRYASKIMVASR